MRWSIIFTWFSSQNTVLIKIFYPQISDLVFPLNKIYQGSGQLGLVVWSIIHKLELNMRTNIVLDDQLVKRAQKLTGIKTKREVVHEALRTLILLQEQAEIRNLRSTLKWEGNLSKQRVSRLESK